MMRESEWMPGERSWFEYHCNESVDSAHAEWWYRTRQPVTILGRADCEPCAWQSTAAERSAWLTPRIYAVRWDDGFEGDVFEDELHESPDYEWLDDPQYIEPPIRRIPC